MPPKRFPPLKGDHTMAQVNPDPHKSGYVFLPANRVTGIFSTVEDAQGALQALNAQGWGTQHIDVFVGAEGADTLDLQGQRHGIVVRVMRNIEAFIGDVEAELHRQADTALRAGGCVMGVLMAGKEDQKNQVAAILKDNHGQLIHYWSHWTIERLG
jgi:hypothetical protein